jgi:Predicted hydrolase of the metallo-beta-lactamase superfamily
MSPGTKSLVEVSNLFLNTEVNLDQTQSFTMWQPFQVGEFTITPYLMDHSAPDAAAFLIEADGQRLFYTGDFRGHGRKKVLLERLFKEPISDIDCLIMEGTLLGRGEGQYQDEKAVEQAMYNIITGQQSYTFVFARLRTSIGWCRSIAQSSTVTRRLSLISILPSSWIS